MEKLNSNPQSELEAGDDSVNLARAANLVEAAVASLNKPIVEVLDGMTQAGDDYLPQPAKVSPEVVALVIAKWLASQHNSNTRAAYERDLFDFSEWVANQGGRLSQVTRSTVDVYVSHLDALGKSASTVSRRLSTLSSFYLFANDEGVPLAGGTNPVARVRRPRVSSQSPRLGLDKDEAKALMAASQEGNPRDGALVALLLMNGLRVSEALSLRLESIETEAGHTVASVTRKGKVSARIPLNPFTIRAMEKAVGGRTSGLVVSTREGGALDRRYAGRIIERLAKKAGIRHKISPHSLRHTFVTLSLEADVPLHQVQDSAGHKSPETTMRYNRTRNSLDKHATHALAVFLS